MNNNPIQWLAPFDDRFGSEMIYRLFSVGGKLFGVGFQRVENIHDLNDKAVDIFVVKPDFVFPASGVWTLPFDEVDPDTVSFKGFGHVSHSANNAGSVFREVASIIFDHYSVCHAGAYVFCAAIDLQHQRKTDLTTLYSKALGVNGFKQSRLFKARFAGWHPYSDVAKGGRCYVVTTKYY